MEGNYCDWSWSFSFYYCTLHILESQMCARQNVSISGKGNISNGQQYKNRTLLRKLGGSIFFLNIIRKVQLWKNSLLYFWLDWTIFTTKCLQCLGRSFCR